MDQIDNIKKCPHYIKRKLCVIVQIGYYDRKFVFFSYNIQKSIYFPTTYPKLIDGKRLKSALQTTYRHTSDRRTSPVDKYSH